MNENDLRGLIDIKWNGAILIGKSFTVDGHWNRPVRVITHAHLDHVIGLRDSLKNSGAIVFTPATYELIMEIYELNGALKALLSKKAITLSYGKYLEVNGEVIRLVKANHIVGASQVLIESNGLRIGYTGDFKLRGTEIMNDLDALIIEATYGSRSFKRPFKDSINELFVDLVMDGLASGTPVYIYGYYGKLQEAMYILRSSGVTAPFIMPRRLYKVTSVAEKYCGSIGNYYDETLIELKKLLRDYGGYIAFYHMNKASKRSLTEGLHIILTGWEFYEPIRRRSHNTWTVALSDHADYEELLEYVERSRPGLVIVDASRSEYAEEFARDVEACTSIRSITMPKNNRSLINYS
ncbi:MAG: MBL fold metallo-hydrolase [Sulfolobales archaeon]|nr:MBL fold metallo-hydrolase [Sulfolobales archaeon]MCX8199411.1 MBL fold metallo-hydrolase [Sulfolobales archaeon]MDW8170275.1 MBL fold metallo-hydrolase [Desulfurococcaceae archaeon]